MSWLDLIFPPRCAACAEPLEEPRPLCEVCDIALMELPPERCACCSQPLPEGVRRCDPCREDPPPFSDCRVAFAYEGSIAEVIPRFKYEDLPQLAETLIELAWGQLRSVCTAGAVLVPIPLHPRRLRERGYDQALLLADALGKRSRLPVEERLLERVRFTSAQVGSTAEERAAKLEGAFRALPMASGKRVVLVDDVITTTATARAAAVALRAAGASDVRVAAIARAVRSSYASFEPSGAYL